MPPLDSALRNALERAILNARAEAEASARIALGVLSVDSGRPSTVLTKEQRDLRNALRARGRQLGAGDQSAGFPLLVEEAAYQHWHRMLFARFLAENDLLMHPAGVAVTLDECEELSGQEGDANRWVTAARYAARMLPGIFRSDEPSARVPFAPEGQAALEAILADIPSLVFTSDDSLGWVYQFWQSQKKQEVSSSGRKIEKLDLAAYSQLFTEDYMVRFLLENSLGAWWAARHPNSELAKGFEYLRFKDDGIPAAGAFSGWPDRASEVTVMDPCCGSGHFLAVAFDMLCRMREEEETLDVGEAVDAVIRDNLFGLEIDPRCVQIAAFTIALAAWKRAGYHPLPLPNIACSGTPISGQLVQWTNLAGNDPNIVHTLEGLYAVFANAPDLGSLVDPVDKPVDDRMFAPDLARVAALLEEALSRETTTDPVAAVFGNLALGVTRAAELLARRYTLVATNVPYLAIRKQGVVLRNFLEERHSNARADLATAFLRRCRSFTEVGGAYALVTPQNWLLLGSYKLLREQLLEEQIWNHVAHLGDRAFETITGAVVNVALLCFTNDTPGKDSSVTGLDVRNASLPMAKASRLRTDPLQATPQSVQKQNPDSRFIIDAVVGRELLATRAVGLAGIMNGDSPRFQRQFWEIVDMGEEWVFQQTTVPKLMFFGGRELVIRYDVRNGHLRESNKVRRDQLHDSDRRGRQAWGKWGIAVSSMGALPVSLYSGDLFDNNVAVILPKESDLLPAVWAFCSSPEFNAEVRRLDSKMNVTNGTLVKVPFDLDRWQALAQELWPNGLPNPHSDDPSQWLFKGDPAKSTEPLHVGLARLLDYEWPQQGTDPVSPLAVREGILPLASMAGHELASEPLRRVLASAYGDEWSAGRQAELLRQVSFSAKGLDAWLRDGFFEQHCKLFRQRPFIWHIWDGRRDGFSALVNYHKLDAANLDKLIYTYLGEWIRTQRSAEESGASGANGRLVAALQLQTKLEGIRDGESPYDIYVRWKPLHQQPIGWDPDLNDGVRLNIRPFVIADILRSRVNVNWKKDRGHNLDGSDRVNDLHLKLAEKRAAREAVV